MSKLRSVSTAFWSDPFIEELSPSEKLLYLYFITNEKTNMLGIYEVSIKKISFETGIPSTTVQNALEAFERVDKIKRIGNFIVLTKFLKHQNFNTNMKKSAIECYLNLPESIKNQDIKLDLNNPLEAFETLSNHYGMVRKLEDEYESETKDESKPEKDEVFFIYPFDSKNFKDVWQVLSRQKKWRNKSHDAIQTSLDLMKDVTESEAIEMMRNAIAGEWQGLFPLKNKKIEQPIPSTRPKIATFEEFNKPIK